MPAIGILQKIHYLQYIEVIFYGAAYSRRPKTAGLKWEFQRY